MAVNTDIKMTTINTRRCIHCGEAGEIKIPSDTYFAGIKAIDNGALIQDAFPTLDREQREQIMTGIHPECWKAIFA